ncbi:sulfite exporter TauE/SafE family protein [Candidatus Thioglobus sp.]|uniref:sulfite exporter TauE/SafE family protein n=1 Tax=Candidatus Thioglobus sp. TaxID=2026721 RepID=UPI003D14EA6A
MDILISVFLMGLLGGVHCLSMCGGVVAMLSNGIDNQAKINPKKTALLHLSYNSGRIASYVLMGALFGLVGAILSQTLQMSLFDKSLRIFSGVLMITVGLYIGNWSSGIQILERIGAKLWRVLQPLTKRFLPIRNLKGAFFTGLLWGGIPCGLVYGALGFAIVSGSMIDGGLIMLAFGLGTLPSLLLMASISAKLSSLVQNPLVRKLSGLLIIILGLMALWMPISSILMPADSMHDHGSMHNHNHETRFTTPTDLDHLT